MFSRAYMQALEQQITKVLRAVAADEAKKSPSNKTRKVPGYRFPKRGVAFRVD
ncbi:hypothetical protein LCGC14_1039240 [marine sediment metagenome]|uniref:Uncharacterized protein n=1 Tax=marine sediment metagenome TaxID=412755 RepID=A0A0F9QAH2_9ZZZZ